jgi:hypothetical protein
MTFHALPWIEPVRHCLNCPPKPQVLPLDAVPHPGFGAVTLTRDGKVVAGLGQDDPVMDFEDRAAGDDDRDWRITIDAPLYRVVYQRQGDELWALVCRMDGFA